MFAPLADAARPWLEPLRGLLQAWPADAPTVADGLNRLANERDELPRFVAQAALPPGEAYEAFIARTRSVPTRDNAHDCFNGLMWLHEPAIKWRLNALQAGEIARTGIGQRRGPLRDALTLFDENGALLEAPRPLLAALTQRDWRTLFVTHRGLWAQARLRLFGHALLDKLGQAPRKALTAHVLLLDPLAMSAADWAAKPFHPLPVLGVPGWWPGNDDAAFYDDPSVFRPPPSSPSKPPAAPAPSAPRAGP